MSAPDRRLTPARPDLAAAHLKGKVEAERFVEGRPCRVMADRIPLRAAPDGAEPFDTVLLFGETMTIYETNGPWAWGQSDLDGYVGYVPARSLAPMEGPGPTHRITTLYAQLYAAPALKSPPQSALPFGARVAVRGIENGYATLESGRFVAEQHISALDDEAPDWVAIAEMFVGVAYVWGGRSSSGLDCSALVQLALQAAGQTCPRDSDMQEAELGTSLSARSRLKRGDLIFWKGHVGIMADGKTLLHANAHHRAVVREPLAAAIDRINDAGDGDVTRRARL